MLRYENCLSYADLAAPLLDKMLVSTSTARQKRRLNREGASYSELASTAHIGGRYYFLRFIELSMLCNWSLH